MKIKNLLLVLVVAVFGFLCVNAYAQADASPAPLASNDAMNFILVFITNLAAKYPVVATVLTIMGSARLWMKPVSSIVHQIVELTPSKRDDGALTAVLAFFNENPVGRFLAYLFDWLLSVKIQKPSAPDVKLL